MTVANTSFSGNPKKATVTFTTAFSNTNYTITHKNNGDKLLKKITSVNISDFNDIKKYDNIIDNFPKNDNKRLLKKYIDKKLDIKICITEDIEDYKKRFNTLQLYKIEGAAHWVHAEQPQAFIHAFTDFVSHL